MSVLLSTDKLSPFPLGNATKIFLIFAILFIPMAVISPVLKSLVLDPFELTRDQTSRFLTANAIPTLLLSIPIGLLSDYLRRRIPFLVGALVGNAICLGLIPFITNFNLLLALRFVQGVFDTTAQVMIIAWAFDIASPANRGRVIAFVTTAIPISYLTGPFIARAFGEERLEELFVTLAVVTMIGAIICLPNLRERSALHQKTISFASIFSVVRRLPVLTIPIGFNFIDKFTFSAIAVLTALATQDTMGVSGIGVTSGLLIRFWTAFIISLLIYQVVIRHAHLPNMPVMVVGSLLYGMSLMAVGRADTYEAALGLMFLAGAFSAIMYVPTVALLGDLAGPEDKAAAVGASNTIGTLGMIIGFPVIAVIAERDAALAWFVAGGAEIVCCIVLVVVYPFVKRWFPKTG